MCQPHQTGPDHNRKRKSVNLYQCHQTGPVSGETVYCCQSVANLNSVVNHAHIVQEQTQRKGIHIAIVRQCQSLKYVNNVSCLDQLCSVKLAPNVPQNLSVWGQTKPVLENLGSLGGRTQSSTNVERGLHLTFPDQTKLDQVTYNHQLLCTSSQKPLPVGGTVSDDKQKCSRVGQKSRISGLLQLAIFGPKNKKKQNKWRPILDLNILNKFLKAEKFKMKTPETIQTSSIDFKDTYFHIPIQNQSRKYLRFHVQGKTYQFKALPFGLSRAPLEFTVVTKEVKLMALQKDRRIYQYLDDWLVQARTHQTCLQHTQTLVDRCQDLGWLINMEKSELDPKQVFDLVGYQFNLKEGKVRPTLDWWQTLTTKIRELLTGLTCQVRQVMSLIGLLTETEKHVHLGLLHMRPFQWHLKQN